MNHARNRDLCCDSVVQNIRDIASMTFSVLFGGQQRLRIQRSQTKLASEISAGCLIEASKTSLPRIRQTLCSTPKILIQR